MPSKILLILLTFLVIGGWKALDYIVDSISQNRNLTSLNATDQKRKELLSYKNWVKSESKPKSFTSSEELYKTEKLFDKVEIQSFEKIKKMFAEHKYQVALVALYDQLNHGSFSPQYKKLLIDKIPVLRTSIGIKLASENNCTKAIKIFIEVIGLNPSNLDAHRGLLSCYIRLKQFELGLAHVQSFQLAASNYYSVFEIIANIYENTGRITDAITILKKLIRHLSNNEKLNHKFLKKLKYQLEVLMSRLNEKKYQVSHNISHFKLTFRDGDHDEVAQYVLETAEATLIEFNMEYSLPYPESPIEIVLYPQKKFTKLVGYGPNWAKGVFDGKIRLPVEKDTLKKIKSFEKILRHELVHALLWEASKGKTIPNWFNEGLAQYLECRNGCRPNFNQFISNVTFLKTGDFIESFNKLPLEKAKNAYIQSLFLVIFLKNEKIGYGSGIYSSIILGLLESGKINSNSILKPAGLSFPSYLKLAKNSWNNKK